MPNVPLHRIDAPQASDALAEALAVHNTGHVPLIIDPRAPTATELLQQTIPQEAAWATLTSGTTGEPKIVVRTAESWHFAFDPLTVELGVQPGEGLWMPVHQVSSMALFSAAWADATGLQLVIPEASEPKLNRATVAHVTPVWLQRLLELVESGIKTTLHTVLVGGDRLPGHLWQRAEAVGLRVITYVGAAELSFVAWDRGDGMRAVDGVQTCIDTDQQLWVSSPQTALDVLGGTLRRKHVDGTQWATVGDRVMQRNGVLEFLGRGDDTILSAGATIIASDVETVLNQHPQVTASLVLGQPDAMLGQRVVAWVEGTAEPAQLRHWLRSRLPKAARPVEFRRINRLPRTASGKIRRVVPEDT